MPGTSLLKWKKLYIQTKNVSKTKWENWILCVMVTRSLEFLCFLCHFHVPSVESWLTFFLSIPKNTAVFSKLCFLKQCYPPPGRQLSGLFLKYLQNGFEERERRGCPQKLISTAYLIWLLPKDSPQPVNCYWGQILWSIFYRRCYSPPQIFHVYQSTICYVCYCCLPLPPCLWGKEIMAK